MKNNKVVVLLLLVLAGVSYFLWRQALPEAPPIVAVNAPVVPDKPPPPPPAPPAIQHPIAPLQDGEGAPADPDAHVRRILGELLGAKAALAFFDAEGLIRRFVATVDNLERQTASPTMWPLPPTGGHLVVSQADADLVIDEKNAARYAPFMALVSDIDVAKAALAYRRLYPLLQTAYENLGYPDQHFNDRVVFVIDHLLATPEHAGPLAMKSILPPGATKPLAPSAYQFADPDLDARSAGQKILLRMGPTHAAPLKALLAGFRKQIAHGG